MKKPNNIFLVGPMGAGKTTIGKHLARSLAMSFLDSDQDIQRRTGVDIPTIFEFEGEEGFRRRESKVIEELTQRDNVVLATGGGAILRPENRRNLSARGVVVYLECSARQQFERTCRDRNRPLLQTDDPMDKLQTLFDERAPLYREVADYRVSTEGRPAGVVAREIVQLVTASRLS